MTSAPGGAGAAHHAPHLLFPERASVYTALMDAERTAKDETAAVLSEVGSHLRSLRHARNVTLVDLAARTGLTTSTLSRLENGHLRPTLEQLLPLARAYDMPLDDLVNAPSRGDPRVHLRPIARYGLTFIPLTRRAGGIQAYKVIHPPMRRHPRIVKQSHDGYEWLYVLNGTIELVLEDEHLTLRPGEAAEFDTRTRHWIGNVSDTPTELLMLFGHQGERAHVTYSKPTR